MFKNVSSQKFTVVAFADAGHASLDAGEKVTGDAANITLKIEQDDDGIRSNSDDINPTETEDGQYVFDLTQAETNGDKLTFYPESSTAGVQVHGQPSNVIYTTPRYFPDVVISSGGIVDADIQEIEGSSTTLENLADDYDGTGYNKTNSTINTVTNIPGPIDANVTQISGDSTAADNLESMYDGTGLLDDTAPASRQQVDEAAHAGYVWVDTVNGSSGTTIDYGTPTNPVNSIADAKTIADAAGIKNFFFLPNSSVTLAADMSYYNFYGANYTVALGGQMIVGSKFYGADITGDDSSSPSGYPPTFEDCRLAGNNNFGDHRFIRCGIDGDIDLDESASAEWIDCYVIGSGVDLDFGTGDDSSYIDIHRWSGNLEIRNMGDGFGTDTLNISGNGEITLNADCDGGTLNMSGNMSLVDNSGNVTINDDSRIDVDQPLNMGKISGSTTAADRAEEFWDGIEVGTAQAGAAGTITLGASENANDDFYNGAVVFITGGTGAGQYRRIEDYNGTTKVATVDTNWVTNPSSDSTYQIVGRIT